MKYNKLPFLAGILLLIITGFKPNSQDLSKTRWSMGVTLYSFHQHSFERGLDMAVNSGLKNVEGFSFQNLGEGFGGKAIKNFTSDEIAKMKKMLGERNLKMPSMYISDAKGKEDWEHYF